ncbi:MAG: hypothetical protein E7535_04495 [Ruminococcaceae bacterium]|nr:hypothetical protein [Oscillospiraceae bacterium]
MITVRILKKLFCLLIAILILTSCNNSETEITTALPETTSESEVITTPEPVFPEEITSSEEQAVNNSDNGREFFGRIDPDSKTFSGLTPLDTIEFALTGDYDGFSKKMISHSYGVAKNEVPHTISTENQQFFDSGDYDALCLDSKSNSKVLYLTFDCGYENGYTSKILDTLKDKNVSAAFFCTLPQVKDNSEIIARMINEGHIVGNHSVNHPDFSTLNKNDIISELKVFDDYLRTEFGYSSLYFRFPQGKYSEYSMKIINDMGYKCIFWSLAYADWDLSSQKGEKYAHDTVMERIHPGAVILLHAVSPDNANALGDIIDSCREMGYEFKSLNELN